MRSPALFCLTGLLLATPTLALEFHPDNDRDNPPESFYWHSDVPGSYNPWTDDMQLDLLVFPPENEGVTRYRDMVIHPEGYTTEWTDGPKMLGDDPEAGWAFVDLSTQQDLLTGTNWVHGNTYTYPEDSWALMFDDEAGFDAFRPGSEAFDLSEYRGIAIEVSNLGDTYLVVDIYSKGMRQWLGKKHSGTIGLEPGDTDILYFPFRRTTDNTPEHAVEYFGDVHHMVGYPGGHLYGMVPSQIGGVSGVVGVKATVPVGVEKGDVKWSLNRVFAGGRFEVPAQEEIDALGLPSDRYVESEWVDEYGLYKYDDWVGKVWDLDDVVEQYDTLADYLATDPGPETWNEWGGWAGPDAPQLEARGYFRVEEYNDRWWFVDPDGRLFLSQGALHMGGNMPGPAADHGYTQEEYLEEVYFPRLRAMGINTAGGNSSWKWHKGVFPYTYQVKTGLAPIDYTDIQDIVKDESGNGIGTADDFDEWMYDFLSQVSDYIADPYCIGVIVDNELNISESGNPFEEPVEKIYFRAVRRALDRIAIDEGRWYDPDHDPDVDGDSPDKSPIIMIDPASNGGEWMAHYNDVLAQHRMEGHWPNIHKSEWGKPLGQFAFSLGNMDVGVSHYGVTQFFNQRHRAQGMHHFMSLAYNHPQNIAAHHYSYMKTKARPLTDSRMLINKSDTTDYFLAEYLGALGDQMYRIHNGETVAWQRAQVPVPSVERQLAAGIPPEDVVVAEGGSGGVDSGDDTGIDTGPGAAAGAASEGCGCHTGPAGAMGSLWLVGVLGWARRRRT